MYIAVEGPDGSGKSTLARALGARMPGSVLTRHPGGNLLGRELRGLLKDRTLQEATPPLARRLLFEADRLAQQRMLSDLLDEDHVVISDRCCEVSNHSYACAEGTGLSQLQAIEHLDRERLLPHLVLLADAPEDLCQSRLDGTGRDPAERDPDLFQRVHHQYSRLIYQAHHHGHIYTCAGWSMPAAVVRTVEPVDTSAIVALSLVQKHLKRRQSSE